MSTGSVNSSLSNALTSIAPQTTTTGTSSFATDLQASVTRALEIAALPMQALQADQQRAAGENGGEGQEMTALLGPQPRRLDLGKPIDDMAQNAEQHGLEHSDHRREHGHGSDVAPHATGARPQEREEAVGQRGWRRVRIGWYEFFEILKQGSRPR